MGSWNRLFYCPYMKSVRICAACSHAYPSESIILITYCDVPGSPCLSKKGESNMRFVPFKIFCLGGYLACLLLSV